MLRRKRKRDPKPARTLRAGSGCLPECRGFAPPGAKFCPRHGALLTDLTDDAPEAMTAPEGPFAFYGAPGGR